MSANTITARQRMRMANAHHRLSWGRACAWVVMGIVMLITLFPLYWILRTALSVVS